MSSSVFLGKGKTEFNLLGSMANRHGLIAGATGTGKSVTLKVMAEGLSALGVPVFMADVKGDLASLSQAGTTSPKLTERCKSLGIPEPTFSAFPVTFWDVFGDQGHPVRATVSDLGPMLLSRLLNLNDTQSAVLSMVFKIADDTGMLVLDLKDLQAMLHYVAEHAKEFQTRYGNISAASVGAIQRGILTLSEEGGERFFGEPALNIDDLLQTDSKGRGYINILAADKLMQLPRVYSTFLLWLLSELFERLPEVGDLEKPKLVFFFDEAHLLFSDAPKALLEKIEQVVRLIRSKGVGVFFVSQNPLDIPDSVAAQLGNRVQHALRAFTAKDQKAVRATAETFRADGSFDVEKAILELQVGEALVSLLEETGSPAVVQRGLIAPPATRFGAISAEERHAVMKSSLVAGQYEAAQDRESAYEMLKAKAESRTESAPPAPNQSPANADSSGGWASVIGGLFGGGRGRRQSPGEAMVTSAARSIGNQIARQLVRGIMGSLSGGKR